MTTQQPEALRLADITPSLRGGDWSDKAAAELRRLHEFNSGLCQKANTLTILSARDAEKIAALEAINQELLAALKDLLADNGNLSMTKHLALYRNARAAIAKAERTTP